MAAIKRLKREYENLNSLDLPNITAKPIGNFETGQVDWFHWEGAIHGPADTPYQGGVFKLKIEFPTEYPFKAPHIRCATRIYHPNINDSGSICIDILKSNWSPALTIDKILLSLSSLLSEPNPNDPLVSEIAHLYRSNYQLFKEKAIEWTAQFAIPDEKSKSGSGGGSGGA